MHLYWSCFFIFRIGFEHFSIRFADTQVGCIAAAQAQFELAIIVMDNKIGHYVLVNLTAIAQGIARLGIEFQYFFKGCPQCFLRNFCSFDNLAVVLLVNSLKNLSMIIMGNL